jgi:hypothetical protein
LSPDLISGFGISIILSLDAFIVVLWNTGAEMSRGRLPRCKLDERFTFGRPELDAELSLLRMTTLAFWNGFALKNNGNS